MIRTERLILRRWREEDREPLARLHSDPEVMTWLGRALLTDDESDAFLADFEAHFEDHGFGFWAIERRSDQAFIGLAGLHRVCEADHPLAPCVEIAWRQARAMWGNGYITEASQAALADGFRRVGLDEIFAWTAATNLRSQNVMHRLDMERKASADFEAEGLPPGHPLRPHVVFAIRPETIPD